MASLTTRALISVLTIYLFHNKHLSLADPISPNAAAPKSLITSAARIEDRDINSICGFWTTNGETWSWFCGVGVPCMIDTYIAPNLVFCSDPGLIPYNTYYPYGSWPAGGCSLQEKCCPQTAPNPREHIFDSGATIWYACEPSSDAIYVTTQIDGSSVDLAIYTSLATASVLTTSSFVTTTATASASGSAPSISSSGIPTSSGRGASRNQSIGPIIGGVIGGVVAICIAVIIVVIIIRRSRTMHRNEAHRAQPATASYQDVSSPHYLKPELDVSTQRRVTSLSKAHPEILDSGVIYEAPGN